MAPTFFFQIFRTYLLNHFIKNPTNHNCPHIFDPYYFWYRWCEMVPTSKLWKHSYIIFLEVSKMWSQIKCLCLPGFRLMNFLKGLTMHCKSFAGKLHISNESFFLFSTFFFNFLPKKTHANYIYFLFVYT